MSRQEIDNLLKLPLPELISVADKVRRQSVGSKLELCSILNAKSGLCNQDCKFCAQSARHQTGAPAYPFKAKEEILEAARRAKDIGAERFDIVTSGEALSKDELNKACDAIAEVTSKIGIKMCASLGSLDEEAFVLLKQAGLSRYHHNIETSPGYFPRIVTTHTFQDRIRTIKAAKRAGLEEGFDVDELYKNGKRPTSIGISFDKRCATWRNFFLLFINKIMVPKTFPSEGFMIAIDNFVGVI